MPVEMDRDELAAWLLLSEACDARGIRMSEIMAAATAQMDRWDIRDCPGHVAVITYAHLEAVNGDAIRLAHDLGVPLGGW